MKLSALLSVAAITLAMVGQLAYAQPDAGAKARGDLYNFWGAHSRQSHARDNARSLYYYGQTQQPLATARAKEHAADVRKDLSASQKNLVELKKAHPDNKEVQEAIAKIEAIHKKVMGHCDMVDKELAKEKGDSVALCACCVDIQNDLDAAVAEMTKLRKALKIEIPELPKKESKK